MYVFTHKNFLFPQPIFGGLTMAAALLGRVRGLASAGRLGMECPFREQEDRPCAIRSSALPSPALGHLEPAPVFIVIAFNCAGSSHNMHAWHVECVSV